MTNSPSIVYRRSGFLHSLVRLLHASLDAPAASPLRCYHFAFQQAVKRTFAPRYRTMLASQKKAPAGSGRGEDQFGFAEFFYSLSVMRLGKEPRKSATQSTRTRTIGELSHN